MIDIYKELKIPTMINAYAAFTVLGGSCMNDTTIEYMASASREYVDIRDFQKSLHERIAEMTKNEASYICPGAMAGIYLATYAAVARKYGKNVRYLSKDQISKCEVLAFKGQRNPYDRAIEQTGVRTVDFMYPNMWDAPNASHLEHSITENTVAIYVLAGARNVFPTYMPLEEIIHVANTRNIPVFVDAAAQIPPIETLWKYNQMGATITLASGGKDLGGPQATGLITGSKEFINIIVEHGFPNYGIGRMFKIGRESMAGIYAAIKQYLEMDSEEYNRRMEDEVAYIGEVFNDSKIFKYERDFPNESGQPVPRAFLEIISTQTDCIEIIELLKRNSKPIITMSEGRNGIFVNPMTLRTGELEIVISALKKIESEILLRS
ncbi:MAG: aminotransferase class V-fold PLP-dependent enzyme [Tissierellia bacterium]|nr:aminotransferase class V-fold PLP-dependent enzyme [Tissierellia bacterium]